MRICRTFAALLLALPFYAAAADLQCVAPAALTTQNYDKSPSDERQPCLRNTVTTPTEYFKLSLSWSPKFCASVSAGGKVGERFAYQCGEGNKFGWIVHGLWGQLFNPTMCKDETTSPPRLTPQHPRYCKGNLPALSAAEILPYMCVQPGEALLQGEWESHGACDFPTATAYFEQTRKLFMALKVPGENMPQDQLLAWMGDNNPALKGKRLGYTRYTGEMAVCYSTSYQVIDCP
jgi:ribonuclease T2